MSDGKCVHCGLEVADTKHILWECKAIHKHRSNLKLAEVDPSILPKSVLNGLPPSMTINLDKRFWEKEADYVNDNPTYSVDSVQVKRRKLRNESNKAILEDTLKAKGIVDKDLNARQAFQRIKINNDPNHLPLPYECRLQAPDEINVYTDGSWLFPLKQFLGLGGAGIWWPNRAINKDNGDPCMKITPLSRAEGELAFHQQCGDGLRLYTSIGGYAGSSTRTELAAGIIAICAHGPVHIGSDSKAFVDQANWHMQNMNKGKKLKKPWKLISDGDLWEHFYLAVKRKGSKAVKITWVKGHATQEHINKGITTAVNKEGNDKADSVADLGAALHGKDVMEIAEWLHKRHSEYQTFMKDVSHHIIEAYLIHRRLCDIKEEERVKAEKGICQKKHYSPLHYPGVNTTRKLIATSSLKEYQSYASKNPQAEHVEKFMANLNITPAGISERGITWLELYVLYRCRGYPKPIEDPIHAGKTKATPDKQIKAFKKYIGAVVARSLFEAKDAKLFSPGYSKMNSLKGVGISGKHATLSFNVCISDKEKDTIAACLVRLIRTICNKETNKYLAGETKLLVNELVLKGKVGWDSTIPIMTKTQSENSCWTTPTGDEDHTSIGNTAFYVCPLCKKVEPSSNSSFNYNDLDLNINCGRCKNKSGIKLWICSCETRWQTCQVHRYCTAPVNMRKRTMGFQYVCGRDTGRRFQKGRGKASG